MKKIKFIINFILFFIILIFVYIFSINPNAGEEIELEYIPPSSTPWITPLSKLCFSTTSGCVSEWEVAKEICLEKNSRLPTIEELKDEVRHCGGIIGETKDIHKKNMHNINYYFCYMRSGFQQNSSYWSTNMSGDKVMVLYIDAGKINKASKNQIKYVNCIKNDKNKM